MSRKIATRPTRLVGALQALLLYLFFVIAASLVVGELLQGVLFGSMAFLAYRYGFVRQVLCHELRDGMALASAARYEDALKAFARSAGTWQRRAWLDDWRGLLLGSASRWPFRHLARYNEAWCLAKLGHEAEARMALEALLREQPRMDVARQLLGSLEPLPVREITPARPPEIVQADWQDLLHDEPTLDKNDLPEP